MSANMLPNWKKKPCRETCATQHFIKTLANVPLSMWEARKNWPKKIHFLHLLLSHKNSNSRSCNIWLHSGRKHLNCTNGTRYTYYFKPVQEGHCTVKPHATTHPQPHVQQHFPCFFLEDVQWYFPCLFAFLRSICMQSLNLV